MGVLKRPVKVIRQSFRDVIVFGNCFSRFVSFVFWNCFNVNTGSGLLAIARLYKIAFDAEGRIGWYPYDFAKKVMMSAPEYTGMGRGGLFVCLEIRVTFGTD